MGRIGQSLIMLGQPPYCSLFSVCRVDDGLRVCWYGCVCAHVCVHKHALCKMGQGYGREKGPHLISSSTTPPPHVYASPNWILYYRSSQVWTTHFPLPLVAFFFLSFLFFTFLPHSLFAFLPWYCFLSPCLSLSFFALLSFLLPLPHPGTVNTVIYFLWVLSFLVDSVHGLVICAVDVWFGHLPVWLNPAGCVVTHTAMLWSVKDNMKIARTLGAHAVLWVCLDICVCPIANSVWVCMCVCVCVCICRQTTDGDWPWRWLQKGSYHPSGRSTGLPIYSDNIYPTTHTRTHIHTDPHMHTPEGLRGNDSVTNFFFFYCCVCIYAF